jgi:hypothetical protein
MTTINRLPKLDTVEEWPEIETLLKLSTPISEVTSYIQSNVKQYRSVPAKTIEILITRAISRSKNLASMYIPMSHVYLLRSCVDQHIEPSQFYQILAAIQFDRVLRGYNKESETGVHDSKLDGMVKTMNEILHNMASLKIMSQHSPDKSQSILETIKAEYAKKYGPKMGEIAANPDSRRRVVNFLQVVKASISEASKEEMINVTNSIQTENQEKAQ